MLLPTASSGHLPADSNPSSCFDGLFIPLFNELQGREEGAAERGTAELAPSILGKSRPCQLRQAAPWDMVEFLAPRGHVQGTASHDISSKLGGFWW